MSINDIYVVFRLQIRLLPHSLCPTMRCAATTHLTKPHYQ
jgi:hypothetical protein